MKCKDCETKRY